MHACRGEGVEGKGGGCRALTWGAACGSATAFLVCWIQYKTEDGKFDPLGLFKDAIQWITCSAKKTYYGVSILTLRQVRLHAKMAYCIFTSQEPKLGTV